MTDRDLLVYNICPRKQIPFFMPGSARLYVLEVEAGGDHDGGKQGHHDGQDNRQNEAVDVGW